jgi:hypothetical protein
VLKKAQLVEIQWADKQKTAKPVPGGKTVPIQFNPSTLKISFQNKSAGGDQAGGSSKQFVGAGSTKLSVELLFDTTQTGEDVRKKTEQVAFFMAPKDPKSKKPVPPGIQFEWGSFIFRGVVESMEETIDYFAEEGMPLRATISLSINRQDIEFLFGSPGGRAADGAQNQPVPLTAPRPEETVQSVAGRTGDSGNWKSIAAANDIDDPLRLPAGALLNTNVTAGAAVSVSAGFSAGVNTSAGLSTGAGASAGLSAGASADAGFSAGIGGGVGFSAGAGAGLGASASAGFGAGASAGFGAGASAGFGAGATAGFGASAGFGAGAEAGFGAGASAGFGASAGANASFGAGATAGASAQAGAFADADIG